MLTIIAWVWVGILIGFVSGVTLVSMLSNSKHADLEAENKAFYQSLIDGYDLAAKIFPDRISIIEGKASQDEIFSKIKELIDALLEGH